MGDFPVTPPQALLMAIFGTCCESSSCSTVIIITHVLVLAAYLVLGYRGLAAGALLIGFNMIKTDGDVGASSSAGGSGSTGGGDHRLLSFDLQN